MLLIGGGFEVIGIGIILPYLALLMNPSSVTHHHLIAPIYHFLVTHQIIASQTQFLILITGTIILIYWLKNSYFILNQRFQANFVYELYRTIATKLFRFYLTEDYKNHLDRNTGTLIRNINQLTLDLITIFLLPFLMLVSEVFIVLLLLVFLLYVNPLSTLYVFVLLGSMVSIIFMMTRKKIQAMGAKVADHQTSANRQVLHGLGSFKTTTLLQKQEFFVSHYNDAVEHLSENRKSFEVMQNMPRFLMETAIVTVMLSLALIMLWRGRTNGELILMLSLFGMAGMRLLPSMNRILNSMNAIKYSKAMIEELLVDLLKIPQQQDQLVNKPQDSIIFDNIRLERVDFSYGDKLTLKDINLTICAGQSVGFVGHSGSGKSTLIDVILGLLSPSRGKIMLNDKNIEDILPSWQKSIGYIPQDIYLTDESIKANIAFGVEPSQIDEKQLANVIKVAQLESLINELPEGVNTEIGERGVKLSGGQRQRIGIARALYHNPQVIVMDEATAALDNVTERAFMDAVNGLKGQKTLIMIAHRLTTVENCDVIYFMEKGKIVDKGTFQELNSSNMKFKNLASKLN